jgi:hypothetical protein
MIAPRIERVCRAISGHGLTTTGVTTPARESAGQAKSPLGTSSDPCYRTLMYATGLRCHLAKIEAQFRPAQLPAATYSFCITFERNGELSSTAHYRGSPTGQSLTSAYTPGNETVVSKR